MPTRISHRQISVRAENVSFYHDLMGLLGWSTLHDDAAMFGTGDAIYSSFWFVPTDHSAPNEYDGLGMNHLAISAES